MPKLWAVSHDHSRSTVDPPFLPAEKSERHLTGGTMDPPRRRSRRDWIVDVICFVVVLGIWFAAAGDELSSTGDLGKLAIELVFGVPACLLLWWRRRWPIPVALASVVLSQPTCAPVELVMVFTVAVHCRTRVALAAITFIVAVGSVGFLVEGLSDPWWLDFLGLLGTVVVMLGWGLFVRARRQLVASFRDRAARAQREQRWRVQQARHLERTRIAREMHDVLAHRLSLLSMHAGALEFRPGAPPEQIAAAAGVIRTGAHQALEELREVIGVLRQNDLVDDAADETVTVEVAR